MVNDPETSFKPVSGRNTFVVIVAAGSGSRFGADMPKQFLPLDGKPVLQHSVDAFHNALPDARIVLVLSPQWKSYWAEVCGAGNYFLPRIVDGGSSRSESVHNALKAIASECDRQSVVMIHDGARPLISDALIRRVGEQFQLPFTEAVVPALPMTSAVALVQPDGLHPFDRSSIRTVQTPQAFFALRLLGYYEQSCGSELPDDAAVYTKFSGRGVLSVEGDRKNIKITNPEDIALASFLSRL